MFYVTLTVIGALQTFLEVNCLITLDY